MASSEPCTSALRMMESSWTTLGSVMLRRSSREALRSGARSEASRASARRCSEILLASRGLATTWNSAPASGTPVSPRHLTGVEGPAVRTLTPLSLIRALTRPQYGPQTTASPTFSVPCCTSRLAVGPIPGSSCASIT